MKKAASFDHIFDMALKNIGVQPEAIEQFLSSHKKKARIAVNIVSLTRIVIGYIAINNYESALKKMHKKEMAANLFVLGVIMMTDAIDGYLSRKAHIASSKSGKVIDSLSDVVLRVIIARSSLAEHDKMAAIRGVGELAVASSAIPDILAGKYTSTNLGKIKVNADAIAIISAALKDFVPKKTTISTSLKVLHDVARMVGIGLALSDGVKRVIKQ